MNVDLSGRPADVLNELYRDWLNNEPMKRQAFNESNIKPKTPREEYALRKEFYMPINIECGNLLYGLIKANKPSTVVEFGTSFGISTLFIAAALKENNQGMVYTTEYFEEKVAKAKESFKKAEVQRYITCLVGDALETIAEIKDPIEFVFLDGAKSLYLPFLKAILPKLAQNAILIADNTNSTGLKDYLEYVREPKNGFISSPIRTERNGGTGFHEVSFYTLN